MTDQPDLVSVNDVEWQLKGVGSHEYQGLLYDARKGVTASQIMLYQAFVGMVERKQKPPLDMLSFIAKEMDMVLTGKQTPRAMFNKSGKKLPTSSPHYWQLVEVSRGGIDGDIHAAFEQVSKTLGGKPSSSQVRDHYYRENKRLQRIKLVGELLAEYDSILEIPRDQRTLAHQERLQEIDGELAETYKIPADLA